MLVGVARVRRAGAYQSRESDQSQRRDRYPAVYPPTWCHTLHERSLRNVRTKAVADKIRPGATGGGRGSHELKPRASAKTQTPLPRSF